MKSKQEPKLSYFTRKRIQRLYKERFSLNEILIMYHDKPWREVVKATKGIKRNEGI